MIDYWELNMFHAILLDWQLEAEVIALQIKRQSANRNPPPKTQIPE
jgi:hypothetical protein